MLAIGLPSGYIGLRSGSARPLRGDFARFLPDSCACPKWTLQTLLVRVGEDVLRVLLEALHYYGSFCPFLSLSHRPKMSPNPSVFKHFVIFAIESMSACCLGRPLSRQFGKNSKLAGAASSNSPSSSSRQNPINRCHFNISSSDTVLRLNWKRRRPRWRWTWRA